MKKYFSKAILCFALAMLVLAVAPKSKAATNLGITVTDLTSSKINFNVENFSGYYQVYLGTSPQAMVYKNYSWNASCSQSGLTPGTTYYLQVKESSKSGTSTTYLTGNVSPVISFQPLEDPTDLYQTGATKNSITLSWTAVRGATSYKIYIYDGSDNLYELGETSSTQYTVKTNLNPGSAYSFAIRSVQSSQLGTFVSSNYKFEYQKFYTKAAAPTGVRVSSYYSSLNKMYFACDPNTNASGYQFELRNAKNKKIRTYNGSSYSTDSMTIIRGKFMKFRFRSYFNLNDTTRIYSPWSKYKVFGVLNGKYYAAKGKIHLRMKKLNGATKEVVQISSVSSTAGFKTVKVLKGKTLKKKALNYTLTKCGKSRLKRGHMYYIRVISYGKCGKGAKGKSPVSSSASVYVPMYS